MQWNGHHRTVESRRERIKKLRAELEKGNILGTALKNAGIKDNSFIGYHNKGMYKDRLNRFVESCRQRGQGRRDDMVEDAQFKRLAEGKASGSEYEFYLTNRRTSRWKKTTDFGSTAGAPILIKPPIINYISVSVSSKEPIDVKVENNPDRMGEHV